MSKADGRSLSEESLELLRCQAHRLRQQQGRTWAEIATIVGVHLSTVMSWSRRFDLDSAAAGEVASARRGRRFGEGRTLELSDEAGLRELIVSALPSALGPGAALFAVEPSGGAAGGQGEVCHRHAHPHGRRVLEALGLYAPAARQAGTAAVPGAGPAVVAGGLPGHRQARQGRAGPGALGRRDCRAPRHGLGARLCGGGSHAGGGACGEAALAGPHHDLGAEQPRAAAIWLARQHHQHRALHRLHGRSDARRGVQGVSHRGQPARAPRGQGAPLAARQERPHQVVLPAAVLATDEPRRVGQPRSQDRVAHAARNQRSRHAQGHRTLLPWKP